VYFSRPDEKEILHFVGSYYFICKYSATGRAMLSRCWWNFLVISYNTVPLHGRGFVVQHGRVPRLPCDGCVPQIGRICKFAGFY
jgi:hypothetical protein